MKIAFIFPEKLPLKKARAVAVINTAAELAKFTPTTLILPYNAASKKELEKFYDIDLSKLDLLYFRNNLGKIRSTKIFNFFLKKYLRQFDCFYVRHLKVAKFLLENKLAFQRVVFEAHEVFFESLKEEKPWMKKKIKKLKLFEKSIYSNVDGIVFLNSTLRLHFFNTFDLKNLATEVIYHGVKKISDFVEKDFFKIRELFYCGSFYKWKGLEVAFQALKEIPEISLYIIGNDSEQRKQELLFLAKNLGVSNRIKFLGYKTQGEVYQILLNQAKITLIPNTKSIHNFFSFPLKMLEYMATSNIVIAADTPVIKEIIQDGYNGFLFKTGDKLSLAETIKKVVNISPKRLLEISKNAYKTSTRFSYFNRAQKIYNFLKSLF